MGVEMVSAGERNRKWKKQFILHGWLVPWSWPPYMFVSRVNILINKENSYSCLQKVNACGFTHKCSYSEIGEGFKQRY